MAATEDEWAVTIAPGGITTERDGESGPRFNTTVALLHWLKTLPQPVTLALLWINPQTQQFPKRSSS